MTQAEHHMGGTACKNTRKPENQSWTIGVLEKSTLLSHVSSILAALLFMAYIWPEPEPVLPDNLVKDRFWGSVGPPKKHAGTSAVSKSFRTSRSTASSALCGQQGCGFCAHHTCWPVSVSKCLCDAAFLTNYRCSNPFSVGGQIPASHCLTNEEDEQLTWPACFRRLLLPTAPAARIVCPAPSTSYDVDGSRNVQTTCTTKPGPSDSINQKPGPFNCHCVVRMTVRKYRRSVLSPTTQPPSSESTGRIRMAEANRSDRPAMFRRAERRGIHWPRKHPERTSIPKSSKRSTSHFAYFLLELGQFNRSSPLIHCMSLYRKKKKKKKNIMAVSTKTKHMMIMISRNVARDVAQNDPTDSDSRISRIPRAESPETDGERS